MKIVFNVPDGEYCLDCPHQEKFGVEEIEITTLGDSFRRYTRVIVANCHLFNERITGTSLEKMGKCLSCEVNGIADNGHLSGS